MRAPGTASGCWPSRRARSHAEAWSPPPAGCSPATEPWSRAAAHSCCARRRAPAEGLFRRSQRDVDRSQPARNRVVLATVRKRLHVACGPLEQLIRVAATGLVERESVAIALTELGCRRVIAQLYA